jgi:hypothetical protein
MEDKDNKNNDNIISYEITLSKESLQRMGEVRKRLWYGGLEGLVYGTLFGLSSSLVVMRYYPHIITKSKLTRTVKLNYIVFSTLISGSIGSFLGAVVQGKNSFLLFADVFTNTTTSKSSYNHQLNENWKEVTSDDVFQRRKESIEKMKEIKNQHEAELKRRSF